MTRPHHEAVQLRTCVRLALIELRRSHEAARKRAAGMRHRRPRGTAIMNA